MKEAVYHTLHQGFVLMWKWDPISARFVSLQTENGSWKFETTVIGVSHAEER